jgi:hypothetical protein
MPRRLHAVASSPSSPSRRLTYRKKQLASFALVAAIALAAVTCKGGGSGGSTKPNDVAPAESPTMVPETASGFLDPLRSEHAARDLFEVEAPNAEYWRLFTLDRYDGETWTSGDPEGQRGQTFPTPTELPQDPGVI